MIQWILRIFFLLFAVTLSLQFFPHPMSPPDFRWLAVAGTIAAVGFGLEALARRVDGRILAGALLGLSAGAVVGAFLWRVVPEGTLAGMDAALMRPALLLVALYFGASLGAR